MALAVCKAKRSHPEKSSLTAHVIYAPAYGKVCEQALLDNFQLEHQNEIK